MVGQPVNINEYIGDASTAKFQKGDRVCDRCFTRRRECVTPRTCRGVDGQGCGSRDLKKDSRTKSAVRFGADKSMYLCVACAESFSRCPHGKVKYRCTACNPCPHGKRKDHCADCNPCPHGKRKGNCAACVGCEHGKLQYRCAACKSACQ